MWIAICAVAVAVLVAAAFAGLGRFGVMPQRPVTDRPKGRVPDGAVTPELLAELRVPRALSGYRPWEVDRYLEDVAAGIAGPADEASFEVVWGGYDMQVVDELLARPRTAHDEPTPGDEAVPAPESTSDEAFMPPASTPQTGTDLEDAE